MKHRQQWIAMLAKLVAPMDATQAAKGLADMLSMFAAYPDAAFTIDSLEYVASRLKRVPTYSELNQLLGGWWKDHRPTPIAIQHDRSDLNKIRQQHAEAEASWKDITASEVRAKLREINTVPERMHHTLGHILATALDRHAPHLLGLLPPKYLEPSPERDRMGRVQAPPKPAYVVQRQRVAEPAK